MCSAILADCNNYFNLLKFEFVHSLSVSVSHHFSFLKWETPTFILVILWPNHPYLNPVNCKICTEMQQLVYIRNVHNMHGWHGFDLCNITDLISGGNVSKDVFTCMSKDFCVFNLSEGYTHAYLYFSVSSLWILQVRW